MVIKKKLKEIIYSSRLIHKKIYKLLRKIFKVVVVYFRNPIKKTSVFFKKCIYDLRAYILEICLTHI